MIDALGLFTDSSAVYISLTVLVAFAVLNLFLRLKGVKNSYELGVLASIFAAVYFLVICASPYWVSQQLQNQLIALALGLVSAALFYLPVRRGFLWVAKTFTAAALITIIATLALMYVLKILQTPLISELYPPDLRLFSVILLTILLALFSRRLREFKLGYVKILELPENYLTKQKNQNQERLPDFLPVLENAEARRLIQAMVAKGRRFALLTGFVRGEGKMFFIIQGGELAANYLKASFESLIPGLKTEVVKCVDIAIPNVFVIHLKGKARPHKEAPLEAVYEQLAQLELSGFVYIYVKPHNTLKEKIHLFRKRKKFEKLAQKRAGKKNYQMSLRERRLQLEIEHRLVEMGIYVVVSGETVEEAKRNAENLVGSLASGLENPKHVKTVSGWRARRILEKIINLRCGAPMNISRWEASALLQLPRRDVGIRIRKIAAFAHTPTPPKSPSLIVGNLMRDGRKLRREVTLELRHLDAHILVIGTTKAGKSNLMLWLCFMLPEKGVNFVVFEPIKEEYRSLLNHKDVNIFTPGDENGCPIRFNPMEVIEGVQVNKHISNLVEIFRYVFYLWDPLPELLRMGLSQAYKKKGWNVRKNRRGPTTPTLIDLCDAIEEIVQNTRYEDKVGQNILAAFITRLRSLTLDNMGEMLVPKKSMPFKVLEEKPTIFELQNLGEDDQVLVTSLLLNWIYENQRVKKKGWRKSKGVNLLCIIEEAHRVVGNRKGSFGEETTQVKEYSSKILSQLLSEARAFGLGVALVDQYPGRLPEDAVKNTHTKFILQLPDEEDRRRMGLSVGLDLEQIRAILDFETGVAALWNQGEPVKQVKIPNLEEMGYSAQEVTDEMVKEHMEPLYQKYGWREHNPLVDIMPSDVYTQYGSQKNPGEPAAAGKPMEARVHTTITRMVNNSKFGRIYQRLNQPPYQELRSFLEKTAENIANLLKISDKDGEILNTLQKLAAEKYPKRERE